MNKKRNIILCLGTICAASAITISLAGSNLHFIGEKASATGKHFAAVMPTASAQGIREYWTDCNGGNPVFEEPQYACVDATLTDDQKAAILANPGDNRIIPTLTRIQTAVSKNVDGTNPYDLTFVNDAFGYTYLDSTAKGQITGADVTKIENAYVTFNTYFDVVYDAGKDVLPTKDQAFVTISRGYDADYGDVLEINTTQGQSGGTSELYFYGLNPNKVTYGANDFVNFAVYSPFAAAGNTSQTYWCGPYPTAKKISATPQAWTNISSLGSELNTNGAYATAFNGAVSLQRYVNGSIDPYSGTYKMSSIVVEKELTEEGLTVLRGKNSLTDAHTWKTEAIDSVITYGVLTEYGTATQLDMKAKTGVVELKWTGLNTGKLKNYKYARMFVYAKTTQKVYVSLANWRNNVVSIPGLDPFASDNGTKANAYGANVVANQWNIIDIPTEYLKKDTDGTIFIEIWEDQNVAADGWLFTDMIGHNQACVIDNGGLLVNHSGTVVDVVNDTDIGPASKVTINAASNCFVKQNKTHDITAFTNVEFMVKNVSDSSVTFLLYKIGAQYGNKVKGSYFTVQVPAGESKSIKINIAEYFGEYTSEASMMFKVEGSVGKALLFGCIEVK